MKAKRTAFCGLMAALALVFLFVASAFPSGKLGFTALAGVFPALAVIAGGVKWGLFSWAAAGILALILLPDKFLALLFLAALGLYPILKSPLEHIRFRAVEWCCKFLYFNLVLTICFLVFRSAFLPFLPGFLATAIPLYGCGNAVFLVYDIALSRLLTACVKPIRKSLHKG